MTTSTKCEGCQHREPKPLWVECDHPSSQYQIAEKVPFHTTNHMRTIGACGSDGRLFNGKR